MVNNGIDIFLLQALTLGYIQGSEAGWEIHSLGLISFVT